MITLCLALTAAVPALEAEIRRQIEASLPEDLGLVELSVPGDLTGTRPAVRWQNAPRRGTRSVAVTVERGGAAHTAWVRVELAEIKEVALARRALRAGERIAAADLVVVRRPAQRWLPPAALEGAEVLAPIAAGEALLPASRLPTALRLLPPLPRGHAVRAVARVGRAEVAAPAALVRPARPGQRAEARIAGGGRTVRGTLIDTQTMRVEE
jgi:flagella basal body P-ring formation protein FlgA